MRSANYVKMYDEANGGGERAMLSGEIFRVVRRKDIMIKGTEKACPIAVHPQECEAAGLIRLSPIFVKRSSHWWNVRATDSDTPISVSHLCGTVRANEHHPAVVEAFLK